jgi:hypothetical protein
VHGAIGDLHPKGHQGLAGAHAHQTQASSKMLTPDLRPTETCSGSG